MVQRQPDEQGVGQHLALERGVNLTRHLPICRFLQRRGSALVKAWFGVRVTDVQDRSDCHSTDSSAILNRNECKTVALQAYHSLP